MSAALLVCSGGGHLKQLFALADRVGIAAEDQHWVTFRNGLSEGLLADRTVTYAPFTAPRDLLNVARMTVLARRVLKNHDFDLAISTGSSPALAFLPLAASRGIASHYIESAARADGPSVTGRLIAKSSPRISTYTQYPAWANSRWLYRGSIYDSYEAGPVAAQERPIRRAVVSVGTQDGYAFDRLFDALVPMLEGCDEVLWQSGIQDLTRYGIEGRRTVPHGELKTAVAEADVVVAHSGTGAALTALDQGKCPILVPRLARFNEHVDDHQLQIGREMDRRGLALLRAPEDLKPSDLHDAARRSTVVIDAPQLMLSDERATSGRFG